MKSSCSAVPPSLPARTRGKRRRWQPGAGNDGPGQRADGKDRAIKRPEINKGDKGKEWRRNWHKNLFAGSAADDLGDFSGYGTYLFPIRQKLP
jgi:hypothetical protein